MKKLMSLFQEAIGIPLPEEILNNTNLVPLDGKKEEDSLLWGTESALNNMYLVQGRINSFLTSCPGGYYLVGVWGHGVNSYGFYYSIVDNRRKILFRLPYGGVYMDNKKMAKQIREFLENYIKFEWSIAPTIKSLIAIDSMEEGYYKFILKNGKAIELRESFFNNPNFKDRFDESMHT
jgi:hypothetical protein